MSKTVNLKMRFIRAKLEILGYKTKTFNPAQGCYALGRIGDELTHYLEPSNNESKEKYLKEVEEDELFIENQKELYSNIRQIYPSFGMKMKQKVSEQDWKLYSNMVKQTARLLVNLTYTSKRKNLVNVSRMEKEDAISEIIDSKEFAQACKIEDEFMLKEYETFREYANNLEYEDEEVSQTISAANLAQLVRESQIEADKKKMCLSSYEKYEEMLRKLSKRTVNKGDYGEDGSRG